MEIQEYMFLYVAFPIWNSTKYKKVSKFTSLACASRIELSDKR